MNTNKIPVPTEKELFKYRPIPFYFITTNNKEELSFDTVYESLSKLKEDGFGGIILFNKPESGFNAEEYLSDSWFAMVKNFISAAEKLELPVWINDGFNYPPGDAGGRINEEKYPHLKQQCLVLSDGEVEVKTVDWGFPAFEEPESAELFHKYVYEAYLREIGEHFGKTFKGFFSDADNRRVTPAVFSEDFPIKKYYPWSSCFKDSFIKKYGYDITPFLPQILKHEQLPQMVDYWEHSGHLYQSWFASNYDWCKEHGIEYSFHTSDTVPFPQKEAPRSSIYTEGRTIDMVKNCDYPGTDHELLELNGKKHMRKDEYWIPKASWGGKDDNIRNPEFHKVKGDICAKQVASSAHLYNKKGTLCEMFAATNWGASAQDLRQISSWQIMQGVNFIVPHAYHHRLHGELKYFAPPDFSPKSHLSASMKSFNDELAQRLYFATLGKYDAKVAVLDLTKDVWSGHNDLDLLFETCAELNRLPIGYVIANVEEIEKNKDAFSVVVNTGKELSKEVAAKFESLGMTVVSANEIWKLTDLIASPVSYQGEGKPHFMCRRLDNGELVVLIANIEDSAVIKGTLTVEGQVFNISLYCGEIACFTKDGQVFGEKPLTEDGKEIKLPENVKVSWNSENIIPLEFWTDEKGNPISKIEENSELHFLYSCFTEDVSEIKLYIPKSVEDKIEKIVFDNNPISNSIENLAFDERYLCYSIKHSGKSEKHELVIIKTKPIDYSERIFLSGNFDVDLKTENHYFKSIGGQYSLNRYIPEKAEVVLKKRREMLETCTDWCEQGQPFYSGKATYHFDLDLPSSFGEGILKIENVRDFCSVSLDGKDEQKRIYAPYVFELKNIGGKHTLNITVENTLANSMETYLAPSGILGGIKLICR